MTEVDKIIQQVAQVMSWLRTGKGNEDIRNEMYSAAAKTCLDLAGRIEQLRITDSEEQPASLDKPENAGKE